MKKRLLVAVVTGLCVLLGIAAYHFLSRDRNTPASTYRVAIAIPVNIRAINTFVDGVRAGLSGGNVEVKEFSAEGDEHRFASVIKSAVLWKPDVLIVFGTQLTDTALGPQFRDSLPRTIAAAISAPEEIEALSEIGLAPPRKRPFAFVSDTPRRDIYAQSAAVIKEMLQGRDQVAGILYNESEKNSKTTATRLKDALEQVSVVPQMGLLTGADDVLTSTKVLLVKGCRLVVIPHDKYALPKAAAIVKVCSEASSETPVPVFSLDDGVVRDSGVAVSVSVSYAKLGRITGGHCLDILRGADPASLPVVALDEATVFINRSATQHTRCSLSAATLKQATIVDALSQN